jgi:hypothetical protein
MHSRLLALAALAVLAAPASTDYSFRDAPLNSLGVKGLADLRGKPIVIDFWGRN